MINRKKRWGFVGIFGGVLVLMGWMTFSMTCAQETSYEYEQMEDAVIIQLDEEPQLQSPIRTYVAARDQNYTLHFKETMDKHSVEQAIVQQAHAYADEHTYASPPDFLFSWNGDQELHLTAKVLPHTQESGQPDHSYVIDVSGAHTKSGQELAGVPNFTSLLALPKQLWRVSVDGKVRETATALKQPYDMQVLDEEGRYLLLSRYTEYCGCSTDYQKLYSVYDTVDQTSTPYPVQLQTFYMGQGNFVADKRGFFYMAPSPKGQVPAQETAVTIDVKNHVHGAAFSKDRKFVLMVVENPFADENSNDFIIYNLATGEKTNLGTQVRGKGDKKEPVRFTDDGDSVYFTMQDPANEEGEFKELGYQYSWKNKTLKPWVSPVGAARGVFLSASSDGAYRVYANGGIYRGTERIGDPITLDTGYWLPGTHLLADIYLNDHLALGPGTIYDRDLILYNADRHTYDILLSDLPSSTQIVGASQDGKWVYVESDANLKMIQAE